MERIVNYQAPDDISGSVFPDDGLSGCPGRLSRKYVEFQCRAPMTLESGDYNVKLYD